MTAAGNKQHKPIQIKTNGCVQLKANCSEKQKREGIPSQKFINRGGRGETNYGDGAT